MTHVPMVNRPTPEFWMPVPEEGGLRIGGAFVLVTIVTMLVAGLAFFADARIISAVIVGAWAVAVVIGSPRAGIVIVLAIQVFDVTLNPEEGGGWDWLSPARVITVLIVFSYMLRIIGGHRPTFVRTRATVFVFGLFAAWCVASIVWATLYDRAFLAATKILIQVLVVTAAVDLLADSKALRQTILLLAVGAATGGLFAMFSGLAVHATAQERLTVAGTGINALAISAGFGLVAAVALMVQRRTPFVLAVCICSVIAITLLALRTGTRSVILGAPLAVALGACIAYWRKLHKLVVIGVIMAALSGGTLYWAVQANFIKGKLRDRVMGVFETETYQENVRWELWSQALRIYVHSPLGTGAGNEVVGYVELRGGYGALESHNVFLSILVQYNVVGLGLFGLASLLLLRNLLQVKDPAVRAGAAMLLAYALLNAVKGSSIENRIFWQPILLAMAMIESDYHRSRVLASLEEPSREWPALEGNVR